MVLKAAAPWVATGVGQTMATCPSPRVRSWTAPPRGRPLRRIPMAAAPAPDQTRSAAASRLPHADAVCGYLTGLLVLARRAPESGPPSGRTGKRATAAWFLWPPMRMTARRASWIITAMECGSADDLNLVQRDQSLGD